MRRLRSTRRAARPITLREALWSCSRVTCFEAAVRVLRGRGLVLHGIVCVDEVGQGWGAILTRRTPGADASGGHGEPAGMGAEETRYDLVGLTPHVEVEWQTRRWTERRRLLETLLYHHGDTPVAASTLLAYEGLFSQAAYRSVALSAWWEERLAEGHSPDSARVLLGLTVAPDLLALVCFGPDGWPRLTPANVATAARRLGRAEAAMIRRTRAKGLLSR